MDNLNKKENFKVPKGYFKDFNTNLSLKKRSNPFIVPSNYFEDFKINTKKIKSQRKSINLKKMIMPVAASIIFGFFIWNEVPKALTLLGAGLVIISSFIIFIRENKLNKQIVAPRT